MTGPIECTSLITHIASSMGILDENAIPFIEDPYVLIDESYLIMVTHSRMARMTL
jgi:hypothetical protein